MVNPCLCSFLPSGPQASGLRRQFCLFGFPTSCGLRDTLPTTWNPVPVLNLFQFLTVFRLTTTFKKQCFKICLFVFSEFVITIKGEFSLALYSLPRLKKDLLIFKMLYNCFLNSILRISKYVNPIIIFTIL